MVVRTEYSAGRVIICWNRQVCLKLAVDLLGDVDGKLTPDQVGIVQHNLGALKMVLDHSVVKEEDLPF